MSEDEIVEAELIAALADAIRRLLRHLPPDAGGCSLGDDAYRANKAMDKAKEWLRKMQKSG